MFSHVMLGTNDIEESRKFYDRLFDALGARPGRMYPSRTGEKRYFYNFNGNFKMYLAYLRDPTGHKLCALLAIK